jgi:hypothetical protein
MATLKIRITNPGPAFKTQMAGLADRLIRTIDATMRMLQSMIKQEADADIESAGNFGQRWTDGLKVNLEGATPNMRLYMTHDIPYASIFETGGVIEGNPLLWIPLSGTDAVGVRASTFGDGLVSSGSKRKSGRPLLFSVTDRQPRYVGVPSVNIPPKFHLAEDVNSVMSNFRQVFNNAWATTR